MSRIARLTTAVVTAAALGVLSAPAQPAQAASCYGASCQGKLLAETDCKTGAYAKTGVFIDSVYNDDNGKRYHVVALDVWYSPACHAGWAEYRSIDDRTTIYYHQAYYIPANGGPEKSLDTGVLINWDNSIKSCAASAKVDPDHTWVEEGGCTVWT